MKQLRRYIYCIWIGKRIYNKICDFKINWCEKDEYRNGYDNGQGDKGYDDGENEFASNLDESDVMRPVNSLDDYTSFLLWGTDFDDKNNI